MGKKIDRLNNKLDGMPQLFREMIRAENLNNKN